MRIGIFDSGIGGEAVAQSLRQAFPAASIRIVDDRANLPYGDKTPLQIRQLTITAIQPLLNESCDIIVIACNTATAVAIDWLRQTYPAQLFVGLEPMVKSAADQTKTNIIAVLATPATLASERYEILKNRYAKHVTCIEPDCSTWASMVEHDLVNEKEIDTVIQHVIQQNADVIVLGCTHYHWIRNNIEQSAKHHATIIDPSDAIIQRIKELMPASAPQL